jgi:thiosulfate/3-mercaptopyruvate sulfurtransferase
VPPALALLALALLPASDPYPRPDLLAEPAALARRPDSARVLDARGKNEYDRGHVPGAVWVDAAGWSRAFNAQPEPAAWAKRLGDAGIDPAEPVVVCGGADVRDAARVWWILAYWGCKDVKLLNGGWPAYAAAGGPVSREAAKPAPVAVALAAKPERLATKGQLLEALRGTPPQLVDARSTAEYCGEGNTAKRNGMIPGAVHLEWTEVLDPTTKRFKAADELAALLRDRHIDVNKPAVTYCQSGGRAAVVAFALELMGGKQVGNYYKSWSEWGNDPGTPVAKPPKK